MVLSDSRSASRYFLIFTSLSTLLLRVPSCFPHSSFATLQTSSTCASDSGGPRQGRLTMSFFLTSSTFCAWSRGMGFCSALHFVFVLPFRWSLNLNLVVYVCLHVEHVTWSFEERETGFASFSFFLGMWSCGVQNLQDAGLALLAPKGAPP